MFRLISMPFFLSSNALSVSTVRVEIGKAAKFQKNEIHEKQLSEIDNAIMRRDHHQLPNDDSKFKTGMCRHWMSGSCDHGDRCSFAHGEHELRQPTHHGNDNVYHKTRLCTNVLMDFLDLGY